MLTVIIDGQWGSTGKGKLAYWLGKRGTLSGCVSENGPNAGHTIVDAAGLPTRDKEHGPEQEMAFSQLPVTSVIPGVHVFIGPGSIIDPSKLLSEIDQADCEDRLFIHANVAVLTEEDAAIERAKLRHISSTMKGTATATARKLERRETAVPLSKYPSFRPWVKPPQVYNDLIRRQAEYGHLLAESGQGWDLSVDSRFYPYCTGRSVSVPAILDRCGVYWVPKGTQIWGSLRTYPIRVGSLPESTSGTHWEDQQETTWEKLGLEPEITTVTKRVRRVFTWSRLQAANFLTNTRPTHLFLNFMQYLFPRCHEPDSPDHTLMYEWIHDKLAPPMVHYPPKEIQVGYGADFSQMMEVHPWQDR